MELNELGTQPITAEAPAGQDARNDPAYEELLAEVAKTTSVTAGVAVNWDLVGKLSTTILAEKSKDLTAASYLVASLVHTKEIDGLARGIAFYKTMITTFWEDLFPAKKRMRGRKNGVEWLYAQIEEFMKTYQAKPMPEDNFNAMMATFGELDDFLSQNMEEAPTQGNLRELLNTIPVEVKGAPPPEPGEVPAAAAPSSGAPSAEGALFDAEITGPDDARKVVEAGLKLLGKAAGYYQAQDLAHSLAYVFTRLQAWAMIEGAPPGEGGTTLLPAPPEAVRGVLDDLKGRGAWEDLIRAAEANVTQYLFWLDLSRYTAEALAALGPKYKAAFDAVGRETIGFVSRLPGLSELAFSDGVPFADSATKDWLAGLASAGGGGGAGGGDPEEKEVESALASAKTAAGEDLFAGVAKLQAGLHKAAGGKSRMRWRIALVKLMVGAGRPKPAIPIVEQVVEDIESSRLDEFDPALALAGFKAAYSALSPFQEEKLIERANHVLAAIARLDPAEAVRLDMR
jgi:type VI secretion system protein VasJ